MAPLPWLCTMKYSEVAWLAGRVTWIGRLSTNSCGKYPAEQSPSRPQSEAGEVKRNLGIGAVAEATATVDTGASDRSSPIWAGSALPDGAAPNQVGNCAFSYTDGLASTTSYTT